MKTLLRKSGYRQRGAVLIVSLIMLVVMTLFVISMLKTSIVELKIGGSSQVVALNFSNAEVAVDNFITLNNGRFAPGFLSLPALGAGSGCNRITVGLVGPCYDLPPSLVGGTVAVSAIQLNCGPWTIFGSQMGGVALRAVQFDLRVVATGTLGGTTNLHQGLQTLAAPGPVPC
jgi:hypothetical protein